MKLVVAEAESAEAQAASDAADSLVTSPIVYAEVRAALARSRVQRRMQPSEIDHARRELDARWMHFAKVALDDQVVLHAGDVADRHALRALDALHIASALAFAEGAADAITFVSWDRRQRLGAAAEGLALLPETF